MIRRPGFLARADRGTAALEFAIIMPVILLLFLCCIDVGQMLSTVEQARSAMINSADAASALPCTPSQNSTTCVAQITNSQLNQIMQGIQSQANGSLWSSNPTGNGLIMTVITSNANGALSIATQTKYPPTFTGASELGCQMGTTPNGYAGVNWEANDMFIVAEVQFTYQPFTFAGSMLNSTGLQSTHDLFVFRPRQPTSVASPAGTC